MDLLDDSVLLRQYCDDYSDDAFAALVTRHINLVYSVALRQVGCPQHAEEITQAVFILLAKKASGLRHEKALSSWLFRTTHLTAKNFIRSEMRRHRREQEAYMESPSNEPEADAWQQIAPLLDAAVATLSEKDRQAILLRFFQKRNLREVGAAIGAGEEAAKKRVSRALDKLRGYFSKRGVSSTTTIISEKISTHSVQAAPAALAKAVTAVAVAKGVARSASTLTLVKGALKVMTWTKLQTSAVVVAVGLLTVGTTATLIIRHQSLPPVHALPAGQTAFGRAEWVFAGFADPNSAMMSFMWATCQADRKVYEACLTQAEKRKYQRMIQMNMQVPQPHSESAEVARTVEDANRFWKDGSFEIVGQETISPTRVIVHIVALGHNTRIERFMRMTRIQNDWKYDGFLDPHQQAAASFKP